jgi:hypothetical protein
MIEILHFKKGYKIIKLNAAVTYLMSHRNLMCHHGREKNMEKNQLTGYTALCLVST